MNSCCCWSKVMFWSALFVVASMTLETIKAQEVPTLNSIPQYEYIYVYEDVTEPERAPLTDFSTTISAPGRGGRGGGGGHNGGNLNINFTIQLDMVFNDTTSSSTTSTTNTAENSTTTKRVLKRYRQKICDRYDSYANGEVELKDALSGLQVRPIVQVGDGYFHIDESTGGINETNPGLIAKVLDELASRGNFTWRNSFGVTYGPNTSPEYPNKTWTELGVWSIDMYDFSADWWLHSLERLRLGYTFPEGFVDGHYIMIKLKDGDDDDENVNFFDKDHFFWSLTKPFTVGVWIMNLVTIFFTAMLYAFFESQQHDTSSKTSRTSSTFTEIGKSIYGSILIAFRHFVLLEPRTLPGKIITLSLSCWSLITIAIYTANLTSFFVLQNTPKLQLQTIQDVIDNGMSMCVYENGGIHEYITRYYPKASLIPVSTNKFGHIEALETGQCSITLANMNEWEQVEISKEYNNRCQYEWLGRIFHFQQAGFAFQLDSGVYCTSFMKDVFHALINAMINDGTMSKLKQDSYSLQQNVYCNARDGTSGGGGGGGSAGDDDDTDDDTSTTATSGEDTSSEEGIGILSLKELSGPFLHHGIVMIVAIVVSCCYERGSRRPTKSRGSNAQSRANESGEHSSAIFLNEIASNNTNSRVNNKNALATINEHDQQQSYVSSNGISPSRSSPSSSSIKVVSRHVRVRGQRQNVLGLNQKELAKRLDSVLEREDETLELIMALLKKALEEDVDRSKIGGGAEGDDGRQRQSGDD